MWTAQTTVALLAGLTVVSGYTVDVVVPEAPEFGSRVVLECNYRLDRGERIQELTWVKDNQVFVTYRDGQQATFTNIPGLNIDEVNSSQRRVILTDVQDSASGVYGVRMSIAVDSAGSTNVNTFVHNQDMTVGGAAADTLGNRFGGGSQRRPVSSGSTVITSSSSSSSGSSGPVGGGLGNRFGGNRPDPAGSGAAGATSFAAEAPVGAAQPVPPPGQSFAESAAASGLAAAQANLQNAVNQLQNALNAALAG
ncbi:putative lysozyme-like protein [Amphibalanus amphitrite]|uniref:putative lysozyme-like protein n=1 Tax=Amphibalanus amphitrite TaxID=1232801 RepID=UPI001C905037|nr:putative lysozyme-like protein [Amphibalanus amphitrite]